jgi:GNAT superfamily N-acetyltransferase
MSGETTIRSAVGADARHFAAIFRDAIEVGATEMTPAERAAWASSAEDELAFGRRMLRHCLWVAELRERVVGFTTLERDGRIGMLYVAGEAQRRGIGRALLAAAESEAREQGLARLYAEASRFSRGTFEKAGFEKVGFEVVERRGERFEHHLMRRDLIRPM